MNASASDFQSFIVTNNFLVTAAAITIGIASASFIKAFVSSMLMPAIYLVIGKILLQNMSNKLFKSVTDMFGDKAEFDFDNFAKELLTWIFIIIGVYIIIELILRRWLMEGDKKQKHESSIPLNYVIHSPAQATQMAPGLAQAMSPAATVYAQRMQPNINMQSNIPYLVAG